MARPADAEWAVLDEDRDPVPGDPYEIRAEAGRLGTMAGTIRDQITLLKVIAGDENIGKYADRMRESATDLADGLEKVATRYEAVSGYLGNWAGDLELCQSDSLRALARAQAVAATANAAATPQACPATGADPAHPTPQEQQHHAAQARAQHIAQEELSHAKADLARVKEQRDERAAHWKQLIENTEHDGLKDSRWDKFKDFVHQHAEMIKLLADVCTWIVTGLVVLTLLIPGLDIATGVLAGFMLAALLGHTALALSGDGSWLDVGLDVFALATLKTTAMAKEALESRKLTTLARAVMLRSGAEDLSEAAIKSIVDGAESAEELASARLTGLMSKMSGYGHALRTKFLAGGEKAVVENMEKLRRLAEEFPDTRFFPNSLARATRLVNVVRAANGAANVVDQFGHWAGGSDLYNWVSNGFSGGPLDPKLEGGTAPTWEPLLRLKELTTLEAGS